MIEMNNSFEFSFEDYMKDAYSQLDCNASEEYKTRYITFTYSQDTVEKHIDYFKECYNAGISAYIALTQLSSTTDYIKDMEKNDSIKTVYVVTGTAGQYEDTTTSTIAVYETREDAEAFINSKKNWKKHSEDIAIDDDTFYELREEHSKEVFDNAYGYKDEDLHNENEVLKDQRVHWIHYVGGYDKNLSLKVENIIQELRNKTYMYPSDEDVVEAIESSNLFNSHEIQEFNTLLDDYNRADENYNDNMEDEHFKNWLVTKKGYSLEVAEASITVNESDDWSEYNTYYYIDEVNYYPTK